LSAKVAFALAVIPASLLILASCDVNARSGEGSQAAQARAVAEQTTNHRTVEARAGDAVARAGAGAVARAGDIEARANDDSEHSSRKVSLGIRGERGTRFSGTCSIGGEDRRFGGRVPESYSYELGGKKLECEIRKDGPGTLEVVLAAGDDVRSVHRQTGAGSGIIRLTYSGDGASGVSGVSGVSSLQSQVSSTLDSSTPSR
jgi:hypothetical protein